MKFRCVFPLAAWLLLTVTACSTAGSAATVATALTPTPEPPTSQPTVAPATQPVSPAATASSVPANTPLQSPVFGVFEGITPCSAEARPLPQIPADTDCEQMIWHVTLYHEPASSVPTTYTLNSAYGRPQQGTLGLAGGGTPITMEGTWAIVAGALADLDALVYRLNPHDLETAVSFLKISDDLLHVLDPGQNLLVGNGAWSYTLNRTDNRPPPPVVDKPGPAPDAPTRPPIPPVPAGSTVFAVYEGRTRCHALVFAFARVSPYNNCLSIKWKLSLYQDQATGEPSTYLYQGTTTLREGAWSIERGAAGDPDALVYQLQLDNTQPPMSFLTIDQNHLYLLDKNLSLLVGDAFFSYTLSRTN
jgi:hypothetical protein